MDAKGQRLVVGADGQAKAAPLSVAEQAQRQTDHEKWEAEKAAPKPLSIEDRVKQLEALLIEKGVLTEDDVKLDAEA